MSEGSREAIEQWREIGEWIARRRRGRDRARACEGEGAPLERGRRSSVAMAVRAKPEQENGFGL